MNSKAKRILAVTVTVALVAAGGLFFRQLRLDEDVTSLLPDHDPVVSDYRLVIDNFRALDAVFIDIGVKDGSPEAGEQVVRAADQLYELLLASNLFERVTYRFSEDRMFSLAQRLPLWKPCLFSAEDLRQIAEAAEPERVGQRLAEAKQALSEPFDPLVQEQVRRDPLGTNGLFAAKLEALSPIARGVTMINGRISTEDGRHVLMIATPKFPGTDTARGEQLVSLMGQAVDRVAPPSGAVQISYVSGHRAALDNARTIRGDISRTTTATLIGIAVLGLLFFRRKWLVVLIFLPPFIGSLVSVIAFGLVNPVVSAVTVGCGAALIGNAVDYGIMVLYGLDGQNLALGQAASFIRLLYRPLAAASLTTIGALLCLGLSSLPGQRQMGLYGAIGVMGTVLYALFVLPALLSPKPHGSGRPLVALDELCRKILRWRERRGRTIWVVAVLVVLVCLAGLFRLRFDGDVTRLNHLSRATQADQERFESVWGGQPSVSAVVRGRTLEEALQANDRLAATLQGLRRDKTISRYSSVAPLLPSRKTQLENVARWQQFWTPPRLEQVRDTLTQEGRRLKFSPQAFAPFLADLQAAATPFGRPDLEALGLDDMVSGYIASGNSGYMVMTIIYMEEPAALPAVQDGLRSTGAFVLSRPAFVQHVVGLVRNEVVLLGASAGAVVLLLLWLLYGRPDIMVAVFLPVVLAVVVTLGSLGLAGVPLNMMSCLFIVFVLGTGIDYSIILMSQRLNLHWGLGGTMANALGAVLLAALTTMLGFAAMILAAHPALFSLGLAGTIGIGASLLAAVVVVPSAADFLLSDRGRDRVVSLRSLIAGLLVFSYLYLAGCVYLLAIRWLLRLRYRGRPDQRQRATRNFIRAVFLVIHKTYPSLRSRRLVRGLTPETFRQPAVIVANHLAVADIFMLLCLPGDMVLAVAKWVWDVRILGPVLRDAGYILLAGDDVDHFLQQGTACLNQGVSVMVFPEGTRSPDGQIHRFRKGAFELAARTGADILPVLLTNTAEWTPRRGLGLHEHCCLLRVLPRLTRQDFDYTLGAKALADHVRRLLLERQPRDWRLVGRSGTFRSGVRSLYRHAGPYVECYLAGKLRFDAIFRHIDGWVPRTGVVLDAGCGYGLMSNFLARKSPARQVIGLDFCPQRIAIAQRTSGPDGNPSFLLADLRSDPWPAADAVLLIDVLHYWTLEQQRQIIRQACASLRSGGRLVFRDGCNSQGSDRRLIHWSERLARFLGHSPAGEGLFFQDKTFYVEEFARYHVRLVQPVSEIGRSYNLTLLFEKDGG